MTTVTAIPRTLSANEAAHVTGVPLRQVHRNRHGDSGQRRGTPRGIQPRPLRRPGGPEARPRNDNDLHSRRTPAPCALPARPSRSGVGLRTRRLGGRAGDEGGGTERAVPPGSCAGDHRRRRDRALRHSLREGDPHSGTRYRRDVRERRQRRSDRRRLAGADAGADRRGGLLRAWLSPAGSSPNAPA